MPSLLRPWTALLVAAAAFTAAAPRAAAQAPSGKAVFVVHCQKCHGPTGQPSAGIKKLLPEIPTWDAAFFAKRTEEQILSTLKNGKGRNMKPFAEQLTNDEMLAVARYIRTLTQ